MSRTIATGPTPPRPNPLAGLFSGGEGELLMSFLGNRLMGGNGDQGGPLNSKVQGRADNPMANAGMGSDDGGSGAAGLMSMLLS